MVNDQKSGHQNNILIQNILINTHYFWGYFIKWSMPNLLFGGKLGQKNMTRVPGQLKQFNYNRINRWSYLIRPFMLKQFWLLTFNQKIEWKQLDT